MTTWEQRGPLDWQQIKTLPKAAPQFVAGRIMALRAFLDDEPDAYDMLDASGATRPAEWRTSTNETRPCPCPYCQNRPVRWAGNLIDLNTIGGR